MNAGPLKEKAMRGFVFAVTVAAMFVVLGEPRRADAQRSPVMGEPGSGASVGFRGMNNRQYGGSIPSTGQWPGASGGGGYFPVYYGASSPYYYGNGFGYGFGTGYGQFWGQSPFWGQWPVPAFGFVNTVAIPAGPITYPVIPLPGYNYDPLGTMGPNLNPVIQDGLRENAERWGEDLPEFKPDPIQRPVAPSTNEAKLRSLELQRQGDERMQRQEWAQALSLYRRSVSAAEDRADAHFRLAFASMAIRDYVTGVAELRRAIHLDRGLVQASPTLAQILGEQNQQTRLVFLENLAGWVRQDIRDPDRLFLMGAVLHFDGDPRGIQFIETGFRLAGRGEHFQAFLAPEQGPANAPVAPPVVDRPNTVPPSVGPRPVQPRVQDLRQPQPLPPPPEPGINDDALPPAPAPAPLNSLPPLPEVPALPGVTESLGPALP
jgi:hypothetical protein